MDNIRDLREELTRILCETRKGELDIKKTKALIAASNSIMKSASLEMEHAKFSGCKKVVKFLK